MIAAELLDAGYLRFQMVEPPADEHCRQTYQKIGEVPDQEPIEGDRGDVKQQISERPCRCGGERRERHGARPVGNQQAA